ncbi:MAG: pyridoxamine 5'-phosphate oxidase family protein [Comamonadaceae bacterium]|nr:pyridoxamine 5'-phosphate oxidase family protein [Comamonadaceae bacterium]
MGHRRADAAGHARLCFIGLAPLVVLASSGADGAMDASPRGGEPGFVKVVEAGTLLIPDAPGNNRLDTLENIIQTDALGAVGCQPPHGTLHPAPAWARCCETRSASA